MWIAFWAEKENLGAEVFNQLISGLRGIVLLDMVAEPEKDWVKIKKFDTGLKVVEIKAVGVDKLKELLAEVMKRNRQKSR